MLILLKFVFHLSFLKFVKLNILVVTIDLGVQGWVFMILLIIFYNNYNYNYAFGNQHVVTTILMSNSFVTIWDYKKYRLSAHFMVCHRFVAK